MKFYASFKTPDVLDYPLEGMSEDEREACEAFAAKWINYGECITIAFDMEAGTATVFCGPGALSKER